MNVKKDGSKSYRFIKETVRRFYKEGPMEPSPAKNYGLPYLIRFTYLHPKVTANVYCKLRNLPNRDTQNDSTDLR